MQLGNVASLAYFVPELILSGAVVVLCDDVLFTGRTVRAALNALSASLARTADRCCISPGGAPAVRAAEISPSDS